MEKLARRRFPRCDTRGGKFRKIGTSTTLYANNEQDYCDSERCIATDRDTASGDTPAFSQLESSSAGILDRGSCHRRQQTRHSRRLTLLTHEHLKAGI